MEQNEKKRGETKGEAERDGPGRKKEAHCKAHRCVPACLQFFSSTGTSMHAWTGPEEVVSGM